MNGSFPQHTRLYTQKANNPKESFYGREIILADRDMVETSSDDILANADTSDVAFLVVGDPFGYSAR